MLQKRASGKYHSGGLWTNACCSHPRVGEKIIDAAHRKLQEEMGFDTDLKEIFSFIYFVKFDNGMHEHEFDHVLFGKFDGEPMLNPEEAEGWRWVGVEELDTEIREQSEQFTYWLKECWPRVREKFPQYKEEAQTT